MIVMFSVNRYNRQNEGRLSFREMQIDKQPFPVNIIELIDKKVLVRLEVADKGKCKNIIIDDSRKLNISRIVVT
jgi:hypothetical protein